MSNKYDSSRMTAQQLKNSILQMAVQGKLVPQDPNDEPASVLLDKIRAEKAKLVKEKKIKADKNGSFIYRGADNTTYEKIGDTVTDISDQIPFEIPEGWEWVRLATITKSISAGGDKPKIFTQAFTDSCQVPVIANGETNTGILGYTNEAKINEKSITISGRGTIGFSCVRNYPYVPIVRLISVIPSLNINVYYLKTVFTSMFEKGVGTSIQQLTVPMVIDKLIPLPPLSEQHRIVAKIEELLPYIERYDEAEQKLTALNAEFPDKLKKSILQMAVQGKLVPQNPTDEPASVLLEKIRAEKEALIKQGKIKRDKNKSVIYRRDKEYYEKQNGIETCITDQIPFEIPEGWEWCRLGTIISLQSGQDMTPDKYNSIQNGIAYLTGASNIDNNNVIINRWTDCPKSIAYKGNLLITCKGTIGSMAFLNETKAHIARQIMAISMCGSIDISYIRWFLETYIVELKANAKSMIPGISRDDILNAFFPLPPLSEQHRIVEKIEELLPLSEKLA